MLNLNSTTLQQVAEQAAQDAANHPRWLSAIGRALIELDCNPWIERNAHGGLIIASPSGETYVSNGVCQCTSYTGIDKGKQVHAGKKPCWHRAAARLVRLHDEAAQRQIVCQQPDNLCDLHNPCSEHTDQAAAYLQQEGEAIAAAARAGLITMPEGDTLDTSGMRVARKIAAERATKLLNECFV